MSSAHRSAEQWTTHFQQRATLPDPIEASGYNIAGRPISAQQHRELVVDPWVELLDLYASHHFLEIGCGPGLNLTAVEDFVAKCVGTDISASMISRYQGRAEVYTCAANELPFQPGTFDRILIASVLHCLPSDDYCEEVLRSAISLLRPGGRLVIGDLLTEPPREGSAYRFYPRDWLVAVVAKNNATARFVDQAEAKLALCGTRRCDLLALPRS